MRPDILVTGFGPFPHVRVNPTALLAPTIARRLARAGFKSDSLVLETSYAGGLPTLAAHLARTQPRAVLMLGLAARARWVRVELFARGRSSVLHPDAAGRAPQAAAAPAAGLPRRTTASAGPALAALRRAGLRARLSPSAGRYLCDAAYAAGLDWAGTTNAPVLFVHIPWPRPRAGTRRAAADFRPDKAALAAGLTAIGRASARTARLNPTRRADG